MTPALVLTCAFWCAAQPPAQKPPPPEMVARWLAPSPYLIPQILVKGEVVEVIPVPNDRSIWKVKVTHVYRGPKNLLNTIVEDKTVYSGFAPYPVAKVGEKGLWFLAKGPDRYRGDGSYLEGELARRPGLLEWAEAVEKLGAQPAAGRLAYARQLCYHPTPEVAEYGANSLGTLDDPDTTTTLQALVHDSAVPPVAQIAIDKALLIRLGEGRWNASPDRLMMMAGWMAGRYDEPNTVAAVNYIALRTGYGVVGIGVHTGIKLLVMGMTNPQAPTAGRIEAMRELRFKCRAWSDEVAFRGVASVLRSAAEPRVRRQAASVLKATFRPTDPREQAVAPDPTKKQREVIADLLKAEKDSEVAKLLADVLAPR